MLTDRATEMEGDSAMEVEANAINYQGPMEEGSGVVGSDTPSGANAMLTMEQTAVHTTMQPGVNRSDMNVNSTAVSEDADVEMGNDVDKGRDGYGSPLDRDRHQQVQDLLLACVQQSATTGVSRFDQVPGWLGFDAVAEDAYVAMYTEWRCLAGHIAFVVNTAAIAFRCLSWYFDTSDKRDPWPLMTSDGLPIDAPACASLLLVFSGICYELFLWSISWRIIEYRQGIYLMMNFSYVVGTSAATLVGIYFRLAYDSKPVSPAVIHDISGWHMWLATTMPLIINVLMVPKFWYHSVMQSAKV